LKNLAVARRYAKALMLIGKENGQAEIYRQELGTISGLISQERNLEEAICNPLYHSADRKNVLKVIVERLHLSGVMASFLLLLFDKGRFKFINSIKDFYDQLVDELKGITRASLISASDLSSETVNRIRTSLVKMTGKEVILELKQDPELIGGIVTRIGDLVLDGSIKTQLLNMKKFLKRGERV
jgi:F-type H+-transporting ATPase subunit delta